VVPESARFPNADSFLKGTAGILSASRIFVGTLSALYVAYGVCALRCVYRVCVVSWADREYAKVGFRWVWRWARTTRRSST
jgi:hypothetical protein